LPEAVHLEVRWKRKPVDRRGLRRLVRSVLEGEGMPEARVGLLLTGDEAVREMNRTWRGKDRTTDVLSFPDDGEGDSGYLGDIAVSMDRAVEQAPRFSATFEQETARLVVHGLLHLLGYDHHSPAEGRRMKAKERAYLAGLVSGSILPKVKTVGGGRRPGR
jgi:probable rRNA maturation factor